MKTYFKIIYHLDLIAMLAVLGLGLTACDSIASPLRKPELPYASTEALNRDYGDVVRLVNDPHLVAVTNEFGPTVIPAEKVPAHNEKIKSEVAVAKVKPWSSWWFPKSSTLIFSSNGNGEESALQKYDRVQSSRSSRAESAADFEAQKYIPNSASWEGLCDAWALASLLHPEPIRPVTVNAGGGVFRKKVTFSVGDQKALLLKTFEAIDDSSLKFYGQKFSGNVDGWIYPDIFPEQFHRFIEVQLFKNQQAFIMDHDPGIEMWNVPVFKANYLLSAVPDNPNAVFVRMWLYSAEPTTLGNLDFVGTREALREYHYVLEGTRNSSGDLEIESGYWVSGVDGIDSRKNHPDFLVKLPPPQSIKRKSWNPNIDVQLVDEILGQAQ